MQREPFAIIQKLYVYNYSIPIICAAPSPRVIVKRMRSYIHNQLLYIFEINLVKIASLRQILLRFEVVYPDV